MSRKKILYLGNQLLTRGFNPTTIDTLGTKLGDLYEVRKASNRAAFLPRLLHMWYFIMKNRTETKVVLIDTYSTLAFHFAWTSAFLCRFFKIPYIPILHGGGLPDRLRKSPKLLSEYLKSAYSIVSPSPYLKTELLRLTTSSLEIKVIPNLLEIESYPYTAPTKSNKLVLFWLRAFAEIYRPENAIKLVNYLKSKCIIDVELFMVGPKKDSSLERCQELVKEYGLEQCVHFTGKLPKEEWVPLAINSDIFINTTSVDNMPVSLLEMMALGIPVVSTAVGGIPYMIENGINGILVDLDQIDQMGDAVLKLWSDPQKQTILSENGRQKAESCAWEKVQYKWKSLIDQID